VLTEAARTATTCYIGTTHSLSNAMAPEPTTARRMLLDCLSSNPHPAEAAFVPVVRQGLELSLTGRVV
jgi:hypothetical protein